MKEEGSFSMEGLFSQAGNIWVTAKFYMLSSLFWSLDLQSILTRANHRVLPLQEWGFLRIDFSIIQTISLTFASKETNTTLQIKILIKGKTNQHYNFQLAICQSNIQPRISNIVWIVTEPSIVICSHYFVYNHLICWRISAVLT